MKTIGNMFASVLHTTFLIARSGKLLTIGKELNPPAIRELPHAFVHKSPSQIKNIPLKDNSVLGRVDKMAENIFAATEFSFQLDESTLPGNESLLLVSVCFIKEENLVQELLFAKQLKTDTKG